MVTRFMLIPSKFLASLHHPVEGLFYGTYWVSVAIILNCTYIYGHTKTGSWLTKALEICFWIYCVISFLVSIVQYSLFFRLEHFKVTDAVPAWIFPIYPLLVVGTLAGTILPAQPQGVSWNIFVGGVLLQGVAWLVSFFMYGIYMQRLMTGSLPSPTTRPGKYPMYKVRVRQTLTSYLQRHVRLRGTSRYVTVLTHPSKWPAAQ